MSQHYLIHLPHCGTKIPEKFTDDYLLSKDELTANIYQYCDLYTDQIFNSLFQKFDGIKSKYSRLFFDPERFGNDKQESMQVKYKLGWFYENAILSKKPLRRTEHKEIIRKYFDNHHKALNKKTEKKLTMYYKCTVIDCHSFSNERYWFHDQKIQLPDICIGYENEHVDIELVNIIKDEFQGYEIGINVPYAGSLVPTNYWGKDFRVKSVMIEINKKLYLESDNITKNKHFYTIKQKIENILKKLDKTIF